MEFKAERVGGSLQIKAVAEKRGNDVIIHVPSFKLMEKLKREGENKPNGIRNIQSI